MRALMFNDLKMSARYARGLRSFLEHQLTPEEARRRIEDQLLNREKAFLNILERGIFENPKSPFGRLLRHAGIEFPDLVNLVRQHGIEGALSKLYELGVYVTIDEFKGRRPICRSGLEFPVCSQDFDNPLLVKHYESQTSGSRGIGTRIIIDLDLLTNEAAYFYYFLDTFDLTARPIGTWRALPPSSAGMKLVLRYAKLGKPVERWFAQSKLTLRPGDLKSLFFTYYTIYASRFWGIPLPMPQYVPQTNALHVANWLATKVEDGTPAMLDTNASSGVQICLAANEKGVDISGTFFRLGGEPYTMAKAEVVSKSGSRAVCHYSISEIGTIGIACAEPKYLDDVHMLTDKVAVIQREKTVDSSRLIVPSLLYTTILSSCPKLMLNVESGDYGRLENRSCGCPIGELGFKKHISQIRSYDKLTSQGVTFLGTELLRLVEEVLPKRFGGYPTDYQLVEEEEGGLPKVNIIVSSSVGNVSEEAVLAAVFKILHSYPGGDIMSDQWRQAQTLRVVRREPYATASAKILPLHILQKRGEL
jgi:hypothetical protein